MPWTKSLFSKDPQINKIWEQWTKSSFHSGSGQEMAEIVYGDFQEEFQKRALFILLIPELPLVPFQWLPDNITFDSNTSFCLYQQLDFKNIRPNLRAYAVDWLTKFIDYARFHLPGATYKVLAAYNQYLLQLLAVLPAEDNQAETVFSYFCVNDHKIWFNGDERSGYNPLLALWKNPEINEKWKILADGQMRRIIRGELQGDTTPRRSWENALHCYTKHLQSLLSEDSRLLPYSKEFLADQIYFISSLEIYNQKLIQSESVGLVLHLLSEEKFHNARYAFIRFAILRDNNFRVYNEQTAEAAQIILREPEAHGQVVALVIQSLNPYLSAEQSAKQEAEEKARAKEALLAPMRKPPIISQNNNQSEQ